MDAWDSASDWHLPSPSSTPTSANFDPNSIQTPKQESFSSHFLDALGTPRPNGQSTPAQTPHQAGDRRGGFGSRPSSFHERTIPSPQDPGFHVNHFSPNPSLPLPPVSPSRRLASSPTLPSEKRSPFDALRGTLAASHALTSTTMDSSQIQTPPPTRDSTSRRKPGIVPTTPSTVGGKKFATPGFGASPGGDSLFFQTPVQFPNLQFTPDMSQFNNGGPHTAPAYPQTKLFWDPGNDMDVDMPSSAFDPSPQKVEFNWASPNVSNSLHTNSFNQSDAQNDSFWDHTTTSLPTSAPFDTSSSFISDAGGVNPSMIFSFSKPSETSEPTTGPAQPTQPQQVNRQPYQHQLEESAREKELHRKRQQSHSRTSTASSNSSLSNSTQQARPSLARSNTDSGFRKHNPSRSGGSNAPIPRRSSPLKRLSGGGLASIPETISKTRPKTRLVIDENGNARTETVPASASDVPSQGNARSKRNSSHFDYSNEWDVVETESDASDDLPTHSAQTSFAFPSLSQGQLSRRSSKHARADSTPDRPRSVGLSRPGTATSFNIPSSAPRLGAGTRAYDTSSPTKGFGLGGERRYSLSSFAASPDESVSEDVGDSMNVDMETSGGEPDDAGDALRKVREARGRRHELRKSWHPVPTPPRWNAPQPQRTLADLSKFPSASPSSQHGSSYDPFANNLNLSFSTPMHSQSANPSPFESPTSNPTGKFGPSGSSNSHGTRCVCGTTGADLTDVPLIQCDSCAHFLHTRCVGLRDGAAPPPVFVCIFCTGTTPVARGGRVRDPAVFGGGGGGVGAGVSPLAGRVAGRR